MEEENSINLYITIGVFVSLIVGAVGGYYYGNKVGIAKGTMQGITQGREELLAEQTATEAERLSDVQKAANPFSEAQDVANPFRSDYVNPFAQ